MREGLAFVISAPSGAGKSTLIHKLREEFPDICFSVSCATRARRPGEVHGKDYFFVTPEEFEKMRLAGEFAEWAEVHGNFYGTPIDPVRSLLAGGKDIIFDIDVAGAAQLRSSLREVISIFILPPSMQELENRLRKRGVNDEASLKRRLADAEAELREALWYDRIIVNDRLDKAYDQLKACYVAATLVPANKRQFLNMLLEEAHACLN